YQLGLENSLMRRAMRQQVRIFARLSSNSDANQHDAKSPEWLVLLAAGEYLQHDERFGTTTASKCIHSVQ
ncbi:MAG TPA: hypothetical protein VHB99_10225, partial [Pirellulales bacterium]|nr:hypothetical protein [Pirellulales bacterium]